MKSPYHAFTALFVSLALLASGCGKKADAAAAKSEHEEGGAEGVAFKEGRGLKFTPEVIKALELKCIEAEDRPIAGELRLTAQVFKTSPQALASASMSLVEAEHLQSHAFTGAKLVRVDRGSQSATGRVDAVFAVDRTPAPLAGDFVTLTLAFVSRSALTVPRTALLDSAGGFFVYVVNGEFYLRTPVKVGASDANYFEITDGLYAGDIVVATPVEQLWLAELRLTKGGGHSH